MRKFKIDKITYSNRNLGQRMTLVRISLCVLNWQQQRETSLVVQISMEKKFSQEKEWTELNTLFNSSLVQI